MGYTESSPLMNINGVPTLVIVILRELWSPDVQMDRSIARCGVYPYSHVHSLWEMTL